MCKPDRMIAYSRVSLIKWKWKTEQVFLSPQGKRSLIVSNKLMYMSYPKTHRTTYDSGSSGRTSFQNENFFNTSDKLPAPIIIFIVFWDFWWFLMVLMIPFIISNGFLIMMYMNCLKNCQTNYNLES